MYFPFLLALILEGIQILLQLFSVSFIYLPLKAETNPSSCIHLPRKVLNGIHPTLAKYTVYLFKLSLTIITPIISQQSTCAKTLQKNLQI